MMSRIRRVRISVAVLAAIHIVVIFAGFIAPVDPEKQSRILAFAPPTHIHFFDSEGRFHMTPFAYASVPLPGKFNQYRDETSVKTPIRFFISGDAYRFLGMFRANHHLFGATGAAPVFLLGSDAFGRDEFSRLLYGGRISLFAGLFATFFSMTIGTIVGGIAGFFGGWADQLLMRTADGFLTIPWLYLLLAIRAILPLHLSPEWVFLILITILGIVGWARPARLIRGVVLSVRERDYVIAARGFGASNIYLLRKHILPFTSGIALTQAGLYAPQYILAEVTLSFFGLGVSEPTPSWGNMLNQLQQYFVFTSCWWLFAPAVALVLVALAYQRAFKRDIGNTAV